LYFASQTAKNQPILKLMLASDGKLDVACSKSYIANAGIAQSIILDVISFAKICSNRF
jgi:hypothetical protein